MSKVFDKDDENMMCCSSIFLYRFSFFVKDVVGNVWWLVDSNEKDSWLLLGYVYSCLCNCVIIKFID